MTDQIPVHDPADKVSLVVGIHLLQQENESLAQELASFKEAIVEGSDRIKVVNARLFLNDQPLYVRIDQ